MRFPKFQALLAIFALAFSAGVFAQGASAPIPQLDEAQIAQLEAAEDAAALSNAVEALIDSGADARAVAAALAARGQTNAQIQSTLSNAGVSGQNLGQAIASANITRATQPQQGQAPSSQPVVAVTGAGLLVGEDGEAVFVESEADQALLASAFVSSQVAQNPNFFNDPNAARGVGQVLTSAILAANPGANPTAVANAVISALMNANFGTGGNSSTVLAQALQNAAQNVGGGIVLPPVSPNS